MFVTKVGSEDGYRFLPNCIEYIGLGYAKHDGCGRWWDVDYGTPTEPPDEYFCPTGTARCDRLYFKPWNGCGVFYATAAGDEAMQLIGRWGKTEDWDRRAAIERRLVKLFATRVADEGFK